MFLGLGILASVCLFGANAFADACTEASGQYNSAFQAYQSSIFQFPQDCVRAQDYFRTKHEQAQSLVTIFHAAQQACGPQFGKDRAPPEQLVSLLDHETVTLETGCNVLAGVQTTAPAAPSPAAGPAPVIAPPPRDQTQTAPPPSQAAAPPSPSQAPAPSSPSQSALAPPSQVAPSPSNQTAVAPSPQNGPQSCAAQKNMSPAPGCSADFPQLAKGAACAAADNSVGLTLQTPGAEPTCCVTSCGLSK